MDKRWLAVSLFALGVAALIIAPMAQACIVGTDYRVCDTTWIIVLNIVGWMLIVGGGLWALRLWHGRRDSFD